MVQYIIVVGLRYTYLYISIYTHDLKILSFALTFFFFLLADKNFC